MSRLRADTLLLISAAIWGFAFYFQKQAMAHIGPLLFLALRCAISAMVLVPLALWEGRRSAVPVRAFLRVTLLTALAFLIGGGLQQAGLLSATVTNASFLTALYVVIVPLLVWLVQKQRPSGPVWIAVALAFAGSWMLGGGTVGGFAAGDWMILLSTLAWAAHILLTEAATVHQRPFTFISVQMAAVAVAALPLALWFEPVSLGGVAAAAPGLAFVGVLSGAGGFALMAIALRHAPAAEATIIMSLEMLFASLAGYMLLGERLSPLGWLGGGLILSAALVVQLAQLRQMPSPIQGRGLGEGNE